jgi:hypothetical protein
MPRPRIAMRKIREVLRLVLEEGLSRHRAATATGVPYTTVADCLSQATGAGLQWPLPEGMDDRDLEERLYRRAALPPTGQRPQPDWAEVHRELRRKGVTPQLLWMEFKQRCPEGHQYTQFVQHYRQWAGRLDVVLRQDHRAGEKLFLDFSGPTLPITDPVTGVVAAAQVFVAVLGASNYTYAEALPSQELLHWIAAHVRNHDPPPSRVRAWRRLLPMNKETAMLINPTLDHLHALGLSGMARAARRPHLGRRHPRPPFPQCSPHRAPRRLPAALG